MQARKKKLDFPLIIADTNKTTAIVVKLVKPLLKYARILWKDNFCKSPSQACSQDCSPERLFR
jgi:hypothetical protein